MLSSASGTDGLRGPLEHSFSALEPSQRIGDHHPHQTWNHSLPRPRVSLLERPFPIHTHVFILCPPCPQIPSGIKTTEPLATDPEAAVTTDYETRHWAVPCALCPSYEPKGSLNGGSLDLSQASPLPFPLGSSGTALIPSIRRSYSNTVSLSIHFHLPKLPWSLQGLGIPSSLAGTSFP